MPIDSIPARQLGAPERGYVFERIAGLAYEARGYAVQYRMRLGFLDAGVDLLCEQGGELRFVQCKCTSGALSPARIERLLHAASNFVARHRGTGRKLYFDLAVPSRDRAFPTRTTRRSRRAVSSSALASFERYNFTQSDVRLEVVEIPFDAPAPAHACAPAYRQEPGENSVR